MAATGDAFAAGRRTWCVKTAAVGVLMAVLFFGVAGTAAWPEAWLFLLVSLASQCVVYAVLARVSPDLLAERSRLQPGTKPWDKVLAPLVALVLPLATWVIAALGRRFGWPHFDPAARAGGFAGVLAGVALMGWAMAANRFFAATVRIQKERGHTVVSAGPYGLVRHPGYVGLIAYLLATPAALGSRAAVWPAALGAAAVVLRTVLEDRTLRAELEGYREYAGRVRARLVPFLW